MDRATEKTTTPKATPTNPMPQTKSLKNKLKKWLLLILNNPIMKNIKYKNFFLLSWKKLGILIVSFFASIVLHNLISGLMKIEEALFFIIAIVIIPVYFLIAILLTTADYLRKKRSK